MVTVASAEEIDMNRESRVHGKRAPELFDEAGGKAVTNDRLRKVGVKVEKGPSRAVDNGAGERFIQWGVGMPVAVDADAAAESGLQCLAHGDTDILDGVMRIDVDIAGCIDGESKVTVPGECVEHVIEKGYTRGDGYLPGFIQIDRQRYIGFPGGTVYGSGSAGHVRLVSLLAVAISFLRMSINWS